MKRYHTPKLSAAQRAEVVRRLHIYRANAPKVIAAELGVSRDLVYQIFNGREFQHSHPDDQSHEVPRGTNHSTHSGSQQ